MKPERTWTVREGTPADAEKILECRCATFVDEDLEKRERAYWQYEFVENHAGCARYFVAVDGEKVVGHYAVIPQDFLLGSERHGGSIVVDVMTHPDYRYQGMFTAVGSFALEKCTEDPKFEFTTGYPIRPEVLPGHLKVGWKIRFKIGTWVMVLSAGKILRSKFSFLAKVSGLSSVLGFPPTVFFRVVSRMLARHGRKFRIERFTACDKDRLGRFWERFAASIPEDCLIQERTPAYLKWRFDTNPSRDYTYHVALDREGEIQGFVVSRMAALLDVNAMILVDALALPGTGMKVFRPLVADVRRRALEEKCPLCAMMVTRPNPIMPSPWRFGFIPTPYRFTFITRELAEETVIDSDELKWHIMWGDTDDI